MPLGLPKDPPGSRPIMVVMYNSPGKRPGFEPRYVKLKMPGGWSSPRELHAQASALSAERAVARALARW